ncbi:heme oxygenase-like protein [Auriscalpium vulgare]|uniref:Heme oxygenase-like protein n=1 Tax=Auriscalpium vulgare TaxID=40419 RepID=A0ACB8RCK4_9AGAM|nr:heme oxygenase-like protein [Auriscalpium vulgare]
MAELDFTLPISTVLRDGTAQAHGSAETSQGAGWLTRGELDKEEYTRFLTMLWTVYDTLESALDQHAAHAVLRPTYNPAILARAPALLADIAHLLAVPPAAVLGSERFAALAAAAPPALAEYTARVREIAAGPSPVLLLSHAYVRYLGHLLGGHFLRDRIAQAYGLQDDGGAGITFYEFGKLGGGGAAVMDDRKRIKEWYCDGMNAGVGDDQDLKVAILAEVLKAFEFNQGLFASLKAPTSLPSALPPHHIAVTPTLTSFPAGDKRRIELFEPAGTQGGSLVSVAKAVSVVLALCFAVVLYGLTGKLGWERYEGAVEWLVRRMG